MTCGHAWSCKLLLSPLSLLHHWSAWFLIWSLRDRKLFNAVRVVVSVLILPSIELWCFTNASLDEALAKVSATCLSVGIHLRCNTPDPAFTLTK